MILTNPYPQDILVIDFETTAIEIENGSAAFEFGGVLLDKETLDEKDSLYTRIIPPDNAFVLPEATAIHGISFDEMRHNPQAVHARDFCLTYLDKFGTDIELAGWNVVFDYAYLRDMMFKHGLGKEFAVKQRKTEVSTLFRSLYVTGVVDKDATSLNKAITLFDLKRSEKHNALEDARLTAELLRQGIGKVMLLIRDFH